MGGPYSLVSIIYKGIAADTEATVFYVPPHHFLPSQFLEVCERENG